MDVLELKAYRQNQRKLAALDSVFQTLEKEGITLVDLMEHHKLYDARQTASQVNSHRNKQAYVRRARHAVNTRWKRYYDFLEGYESPKEKAAKTAAKTPKVVGFGEVS